jgi:glutathione S-transferase
MTKPPLTLVGMAGSPYTRKMRALLRYRRIPFQYIGWRSPEQQKLPPPPLPLMPALYFPTDSGPEATSDSTFQIRRLEADFSGRAALPTDPVLAFLDFLVEDYADEWVTKMMFHYRWAIPENVEHANRILPRWNLAVPEEFAEGFAETFGRRQIDRLTVVGSNQTTAPLIEASYRRLLALLERVLRTRRFVMGGRPGTADFGLFGQLTQLVQVELTSQALARAEAPRVEAWVDVVEDLSGIAVDTADWVPRDDEFLRELLAEIGRTYAPFLLANARALETGDDSVECSIDGSRWTQQPFRYQGKCLGWLREAYAALAPGDRTAVDDLLAGSGCEALFTD